MRRPILQTPSAHQRIHAAGLALALVACATDADPNPAGRSDPVPSMTSAGFDDGNGAPTTAGEGAAGQASPPPVVDQGLCVAGTYTGEYEQQFTPTALGAPVPTAGPITVELGAGSDCDEDLEFCEFFQTAEGSTLEIHYLEPTINAYPALDGEVDCTTGEFQAVAVDCIFDTFDIPAGECYAELSGTYDPDTESITGTFLGGATGYGEGPGTFTIALQP